MWFVGLWPVGKRQNNVIRKIISADYVGVSLLLLKKIANLFFVLCESVSFTGCLFFYFFS